MSQNNVKEIKQNITGVAIIETPKATVDKKEHIKLQEVSEAMKLPDELPSTRYRLRTPLSEGAVYINISDIVLNEGTPFEKKQPIEIFINCRDMKSFQWVVALTRMISAVLRKGGDVAFIVEELKSIQDPNGGYMGRGGIWVPSLVAEIGSILEKHMVKLGLIDNALSPERVAFIEMKKEEMKAVGIDPNEGEMCPHCKAMTYVRMEGCYTCVTCGHSRCG